MWRGEQNMDEFKRDVFLRKTNHFPGFFYHNYTENELSQIQ